MLPAKAWKSKVDTGERWHGERHGVVRRDGHGFSGYGPGGLGTAPAESDDCRAATAKRWVAGGEEWVPRRIGTRRRRRKMTRRGAREPSGREPGGDGGA